MKTKKNKYVYLWVIQQHYSYCGWEDVSEYDKSDTNYFEVRKDLKEYRLTGYSTRLINRRELNT